jgi:alanyl aminopeptidase
MTQYTFLPRLIVLAAAALLLCACSEPTPPGAETQEPAPMPAAVSEPPPGQLGDAVQPVLYHIELRIDPSEDTFSGKVSIDVSLNETADGIWLHGKGLDVAEAWLSTADGRRIEAAWEQVLDSGVSRVTLAEPVAPGPATLHFVYRAPFNTSSFALFKVVRGADSYVVSQFEPIAARQAFPGFDEPVFKVPFDLAVISQAGDVTITTTPEVSAETMEDGFVRHSFARTRPLPTYLLAFAVGPYDLVDFGTIPPNAVRDREVALRGVAARGLGGRMEYALENTAGLLTVLEEYFGIPYPYQKLDLIAVPEGFGGAMENPGAITYDEYLLLMDEDSSLSQRRDYMATHAHELAHMWFGNLVTPEWWNDIWLNESFASWMMNKVSDRYWPAGEFDRETLKGALGAMSGDSLASARQIREPVDRNESITDSFDGITYQKGGGVLAMLERYVGEEEFQAGVRLHMQRHADGTATAEDFINSLAEGSGRAEIVPAFRSFIEQPGVPLISARVNCDDAQNPLLEVSQTRYAPLGSAIDPGASEWRVPVCVNYVGDGEQKSACAMLNESKQTIALGSGTCPSQLHPNADGAGYYRFSMSESAWNDLIAGSSALTASEALSLSDSLDAEFRAGRVSAGTYLAGMAALADNGAWDVADRAITLLEQITTILDQQQMDTAEAAFRQIVRPRYAQLAEATDTGSELLKKRMQRFLIVIANDQELRKPLAQRAARRLGLDEPPDLSAVTESELETVLSVGVQDLGKPFFDLLLEQAIASEDPAFRDSAIGALARVEDPELVARLQDVMLGKAFKGTEFIGILMRQMNRSATTDATYAWLRKNDTAVIQMIPEFFRSIMVPALGNSFCSARKAQEWEEFVVSHAAELPGYERSLAQSTENILLCAALRQAKAGELTRALEGME